MFGTSTPSMNMPEPMPVPNVSTMTTPCTPRPAPKRTSASPAASASLTTWTSGPQAAVNSASASVPSQALSTFAALWMTPWRTTPGNVTPTGPCHPKCSTSSATMGAIASGVAGCGVRILKRSAVSSPVAMRDRGGLHPRAADVDAERVLDRHVSGTVGGGAEQLRESGVEDDRVQVGVGRARGAA